MARELRDRVTLQIESTDGNSLTVVSFNEDGVNIVSTAAGRFTIETLDLIVDLAKQLNPENR